MSTKLANALSNRHAQLPRLLAERQCKRVLLRFCPYIHMVVWQFSFTCVPQVFSHAGKGRVNLFPGQEPQTIPRSCRICFQILGFIIRVSPAESMESLLHQFRHKGATNEQIFCVCHFKARLPPLALLVCTQASKKMRVDFPMRKHIRDGISRGPGTPDPLSGGGQGWQF